METLLEKCKKLGLKLTEQRKIIVRVLSDGDSWPSFSILVIVLEVTVLLWPPFSANSFEVISMPFGVKPSLFIFVSIASFSVVFINISFVLTKIIVKNRQIQRQIVKYRILIRQKGIYSQ